MRSPMFSLYLIQIMTMIVQWIALTTPTSPACAQESATTKYKPADVEIQASRVYIFVDKTGLGHQHGVEARLLPSNLNLGTGQAAGKLTFDMNSFNADTPAARKYVGLEGTTDEGTRSAVNRNMKGVAILDVAKYPTAVFEVDSALAKGHSSDKGLPIYELKGKFTLHGTTHPLSIDVEVQQNRGWLHIRGNFIIKQTSFGISPYSKAFGAIGVADPLKIYGELFVAPTKSIIMNEIPAL